MILMKRAIDDARPVLADRDRQGILKPTGLAGFFVHKTTQYRSSLQHIDSENFVSTPRHLNLKNRELDLSIDSILIEVDKSSPHTSILNQSVLLNCI